MKKTTIACLACAFAAQMLSAQTGSFTIHGNIEGVSDHHIVLLYNNGQMDTLNLDHGKFVYEGSCDGRENRFLMLADLQEREKRKDKGKGVTMYGNFLMRLFVHPQADISLSGNASDFPFLQLKDPANQINEDCSAVMFLGEKEQKEINRLHYLANEAAWADDKAAVDNYVKQMKPLQEVISQKQNNWIDENPDHEYAAYLYTSTRMNQDTPEALKEQYNRFSPEVRQSVYGKILAQKIKAISAIVPGAAAPSFTMRDVMSGNQVSLSDYKGRYLIIDFWGSWCGPCRRSHPHLLQIYDRYKDKGLSIVGIVADQEDDVIKSAATKDGLLWPQLNMYERRDGELEINRAYDVLAFPTKFLIDKDGKIIAKYVGDSSAIDSKLEELLGK